VIFTYILKRRDNTPLIHLLNLIHTLLYNRYRKSLIYCVERS